MTESNPTSISGFTIHSPVDFGVFGRCYVGFHAQEGRRIMKVLRAGEDLALQPDEYEKLRGNDAIIFFEQRHETQEGSRVLFAHFVQAVSFGVLVHGSELQKGSEKSARELDATGDSIAFLRGASLEQRLELVRGLARSLESLHAEKKSFPYMTPWNAVVVGGSVKLVDVGLGFLPEGLDLHAIHEDVLGYFAPEVTRALVDKRAVQVGPAADVYALALTARSILVERSVEFDGSSKREAILGGRPWRAMPHERFSARLETLLTRAAAADPGRRPSLTAFVKELEAIQRERAFTWTPASKAPRIAATVLSVLLLAAVVLWFVIPPSPQKIARKKYTEATNAKTAAERLSILKEAPVPPSGKLAEIAKLEAIALLENASQSPESAVAALYKYGRDQPPGDVDGMTARFLGAFVQRWMSLERSESTKELTAIAQAAAADPSGSMIPRLAACALRIGPLGVEGGELKPNEAREWLALAREARGEDSPLVRRWPIPKDYENDGSVQGVSYTAGWTAKALAARLESILGDDAAVADLQAIADGVPCFATRAALALHVAKMARDESEIAKARELLSLAVKLKAHDQTFGEGALAVADLAAKSAAIARDDLSKWREAQKLYVAAKSEAPATRGLDISKLAERGRLTSGREIGELIAHDPGTPAPEVLREAERNLADFVAVSEADKSLQVLAPEAHVALGLVLADQPSRLPESYEHLAYVYNDGDPKSGYRKPDDACNVLSTRVFFTKYKEELKALTGEARPDTEKEQALHAKIEAICKLEKLDTSSLPLLDAAFHRRAADSLKGKKRVDALNASKKVFEEVFAANDTWAPGLEGRTEATLALARESEDLTVTAALLSEAQAFLDKVPEVLKARKVAARDVAKTLETQRLLVRQEWLAALDRWLKTRGDSLDLAAEQDQTFATAVLGVVEAPGSPELPESAKGRVAQVHLLLGKWNHDQKKWTEAVVHLAAALDGLPPESTSARSQAALLAAEIGFSQAENVRGDDAPWRGGAKAADAWARDVLAKRLGAPSYRGFLDGVKSGKIQIISDELAAKRLVEDLLKNESALTIDDLVLATKIYSRSARAYLLLARARQTAGAKVDAESAAKTAFQLAASDAPDVALEAARVYFANCEPAEHKSPEFRSVIEKAIALSNGAAGKWKGDEGKLATAFVPLYWLGRYHQAVADARGGEDAIAKKEYGEAQKAYEDYKKACTEANAAMVSEASDVQRRIVNCTIAKGD